MLPLVRTDQPIYWSAENKGRVELMRLPCSSREQRDSGKRLVRALGGGTLRPLIGPCRAGAALRRGRDWPEQGAWPTQERRSSPSQ